MIRVALLALALAPMPLAAFAQGSDELWEISTQMSAPGLPAGMGAMTTQVCQDRTQQGVQPKDMEKDCRITDRKQSGNRVTMTVTCPDSKAVIEQTFNSARTEFKSTMRMTSKEGEMTMASTGRRVGTCDAGQARQAREAQIADAKKQVAQGEAMIKKQNDEQIRQCGLAVETMDMGKFGLYAQCKEAAAVCDAQAKDPRYKQVVATCTARRSEFCKRYQTESGFLKAKGDKRAAVMCDVDAEQVRASLCPKAVQSESLAFLGQFCLEESKPLAQKHCAGRDFTAMRADASKRDKYADFCMAHLSAGSLEARRRAPAAEPQPAAGSDPVRNTTDAINQGVNEGINKLRGIFGR
jgi:hypothetical protein